MLLSLDCRLEREAGRPPLRRELPLSDGGFGSVLPRHPSNYGSRMLESTAPEYFDDCFPEMPALFFRYTGSARDLILAFKHGDGLQLTPFLTRLMARLFIELVQDDTLVVPIPLHRRRYYRRRYNQAAELARHLCAFDGLGMTEAGGEGGGVGMEEAPREIRGTRS